jgi:hypothetical protein
MLITLPVTVLGWFDSDLAGVFAVLSFCTGCISFFYSIFLGLVLPAGFGILADSDNLEEAINPSKILELLRSAPGPYVITLLGAIIASIVASFGLVFCFIGVFFTMAYSVAFQGHLIGQAYNEANSAV